MPRYFAPNFNAQLKRYLHSKLFDKENLLQKERLEYLIVASAQAHCEEACHMYYAGKIYHDPQIKHYHKKMRLHVSLKNKMNEWLALEDERSIRHATVTNLINKILHRTITLEDITALFPGKLAEILPSNIKEELENTERSYVSQTIETTSVDEFREKFKKDYETFNEHCLITLLLR